MVSLKFPHFPGLIVKKCQRRAPRHARANGYFLLPRVFSEVVAICDHLGFSRLQSIHRSIFSIPRRIQQRVKQEFIGPVRLRSYLAGDADEDDPPFLVLEIDNGGLAPDDVLAH